MKITTRIQYGIRFMVNLAVAQEGEFIQLSKIVAREKVSLKYMENIVGLLRTSGLIQMKRGIKGGYRLARPAKEISLKDVLSGLEGGNIIEFELDKEHTDFVPGDKILDIFVSDYRDVVTKYLASKSLDDLVGQYHKDQKNPMFFI